MTFQGSIHVLALYDACDEINLDELRRLIGGKAPAAAFKHTAPEYVRFERPPVIEDIGSLALDTGEQFTGTLQYYDYGVVSVLLRLACSSTWDEVQQLAGRWISSNVFEEITQRLARQRLENVRPALRNPYTNWLSEDYYIFRLEPLPGVDAAEILRLRATGISHIVSGEAAQLAASEQNEVLHGRMSYSPNDLAVVSWNAAFLYDTESGAESAIRLLEYANSQLLQFRHYDELLTRELKDVYQFLATHHRPLAGWRMRSAAARLRSVLLEITSLTERTTNALKFVGDMFSARFYKLCAREIGVSEYQALVHDKLKTADDLYGFMVQQFHQARGFFLEAAVVIILLIDLVFLFRGK